jgi:Superfamily II DNA and RNA helicases
VNYDVARDIDTHTHRIGRTGRLNGTIYLQGTYNEYYDICYIRNIMIPDTCHLSFLATCLNYKTSMCSEQCLVIGICCSVSNFYFK